VARRSPPMSRAGRRARLAEMNVILHNAPCDVLVVHPPDD
jgi:hypothetical protein